MSKIDTRKLDSIEFPPAPEPLGQYTTLSEVNGLVFLSGMMPLRDGKIVFTGQTDKEKGREAAQLATLNALSVLKNHYMELKRVKRVIQAAIYVAAGPDFEDHAFVADGCSETLNQIFPDKHSRLAFGVSSLPMNASVELALIVELDGN